MLEKKLKKDYFTTKWAGGVTTEILIAPAASSLAQRDFDYRISTATVTDSPSNFSNFTGYERIILSLDKPISLQQKNNVIELAPFVPYRFDGDVAMKSLGKCQDFNVIFKKNNHVWVTLLQNGAAQDLIIEGENILSALQDIKVRLIARSKKQEILLQKGETLLIRQEQFEQIQIIAQKKSIMVEKTAILTHIKKKKTE